MPRVKTKKITEENTETLLNIQDLNSQTTQLREAVNGLKEQIKAANVELVKVNLEVINLKIEAKDLRASIDLLKESLKPLQRFYMIASGIIITAIIGALLTLVLIK
jgi:outer membrane murein-binding lipoprotein Lpp